MDQELRTYRKWQPLLLGLCAALGMWAGLKVRQPETRNADPSDRPAMAYDQAQKIQDVVSYVQSKYVDSLDNGQATDLALQSYLSALDPFSEYIPARQLVQYTDQINGKHRGIGVNVQWIDSQIVVYQLHPDGSAMRSGIQVGDRLVSIHHYRFTKQPVNLDSLFEKLELDRVDSLQIRWVDRQQNREQETRLIMKELEDHPVSGVHLPAKDILYVRLNQVTKESYREFMNAVEMHFTNQQCRHLILDLRGNSGGLVHEAASILNQLVPERDVLLFKTAGSKIKDKEYRSTGRNFFKVERIVVLVDEETASAAELIAASLQDLDRARIIGRPTFGKATVLEQFGLADGSAIRLAISRYYTHSGRSIQKAYEPSDYPFLGSPGMQNDTPFISLRKNRLAHQSGVIPDQIMEVPVPDASGRQQIREAASAIVNRNILEFKEWIQSNPDHVESHPKVLHIIREEAGKNKLVLQHPSWKPMLEEQCRQTLVHWLFGKELELRMILRKDPWLEAAIKHIKGS